MTSNNKGARPFFGYDASGHLDPRNAKHLLELGGAVRGDSSAAFLSTPMAEDDLAEQLGEAAVMEMNSGQDELTGALDAVVEEEHGGPFTETSGNVELAGGTDASNVAEATREPFPTANAVSDDESS